MATAGERYAILVAGHAPRHLEDRFGDYGELFLRLLRSDGRGEQWDVYYPVDGQMPSDAQLQQAKGLVVTGSACDAHSREPWILELGARLRAASDRRQRILGICFGHQLMALALGGKSGRAPVGWEVGARSVRTTPAFAAQAWAAGLPADWSFAILESHQDQVLELPPGAQLLGSSDNTPVEVFAYGDHFLGFQGHPEFPRALLQALVLHRSELGVLPRRVAQAAWQSLDDLALVLDDDARRLQQLCQRFLKGTS